MEEEELVPAINADMLALQKQREELRRAKYPVIVNRDRHGPRRIVAHAEEEPDEVVFEVDWSEKITRVKTEPASRFSALVPLDESAVQYGCTPTGSNPAAPEQTRQRETLSSPTHQTRCVECAEQGWAARPSSAWIWIRWKTPWRV